MSLVLLTVALLVFGLGTFFAVADRRPSRPASLAVLLLGFGAPALFFLLALALPPEDAFRFRVALLGYGFRGAEGQSFSRTIGGDAAQHDVWISNLGREAKLGRLIFTPPPSDAEGVTGSVDIDAADLAGGLPRRGRQDLIREVELVDGDVLAIGQDRWTVERQLRRFGADRDRLVPAAGGDPVALPLRRDRLGLTIWRPQGVGSRTYPLRGLLARQEPLSSFLYHRPEGFSGRLFLVALDPQVSVSRAGQPVPVPTSRRVTQAASLHMMRLYRTTADPARAGGIVDRRSFDLVAGQRSFALRLHTPEIYTLRWDELARLETEAAEGVDEQVMRLGLAMGDWPVGDKHLHLKNASRAIAGQAIATLSLPRERPTQWREPFKLTAPGGRREAQAGEPFWLGGDHSASLQVDLLAPPLSLAWLTLVLVLFKAYAAQAARLSRVAVGFCAAIEVLVFVRVLMAYRVWAKPPFDQETMELALIAWAIVPWGLLVAALPPLRDPRSGEIDLGAWAPAIGGWLFSMAWCFRISDGLTAWVWVLLHLALLLLPLARGEGFQDRLADGGERLRRGWLALQARFRLLPKRAIWGWCWAAAALVGLRVLLLFGGFRESVVLGGFRISLSLVHLPLALLLEAAYLVWLWRRLEDRGRLILSDFVPAAVMVVFLWLIPAGLVSDFGLALLNIPVFLFALASFSLLAWRQLDRTLSPAGLVALLPILAIVGYGFFVGTPAGTQVLIRAAGLFSSESPDDRGRNFLRALQFAKPAELKQVGLKASEELAIMSTVMSRYTTGSNTGRGYFGSEVSPHLRATALREHVPAIFIAGEWGLAGSASLILLFTTAFFAGRSLLPWNSPTLARGSAPVKTEVGAALAHLAAATFAISSLYMVLANYGLTLFTGRNAYLLGLDSTADVLESLTFGVLFAWGAASVSEEEVTT